MAAPNKNKGRLNERVICYPIQELPPQPGDIPGVGWGSDPSLVTHIGITCNGPLCRSNNDFIKGTRYKCSVCSWADFCSACIREPENEHEKTHTLLACAGQADFREATDMNTWDTDELADFDEASIEYLDLRRDSHHDDSHKDIPTLVNGAKFAGQDAKRNHKSSSIRHHDAKLQIDAWFDRITKFEYREDEIRRSSKPGVAAIRLIELCPGQRSDKLQCNLKVVKSTDCPAYESVCIAWKEKQSLRPSLEEQEAIYVGDSHFLGISPRLKEVLQALRKANKARTLWVEELCIDNENKRERIFQKRAIGLIHSLAEATIVWAGTGDENTETAIGLIEQLAYRCDYEDDALPTPQDIDADSELDLAPVGSEEWQALARLLHLFVLTREWEYHDISFARNPMLTWGDYAIEYWKVADVDRLLRQPLWRDQPWLS